MNCDHCELFGDVIPATIKAHWVDDKGKVDSHVYHICVFCLQMRNSVNGAGYREIKGEINLKNRKEK